MKTICVVPSLALICFTFNHVYPQTPTSGVSISTDDSAYTFNGYVAQVHYTIRNGSTSTVYFVHCGGQYAYYFQQYQGGQWLDAGSHGIVCLAIYTSGILALPPDSSYSSIANITHSGTYRLLFPFGKDSTCTDSLLSSPFAVDTIATSVTEQATKPPSLFSLDQNYPNPFNPSTTIAFTVQRSAQVRIDIVDLGGQVLTTLLNGFKEAGKYKLLYTADNLASGPYLVRMSVGSFVTSRKIVLLK